MKTVTLSASVKDFDERVFINITDLTAFIHASADDLIWIIPIDYQKSAFNCKKSDIFDIELRPELSE